MSESAKEQWALYPWFGTSHSDAVHPADLASFRKLMPYGKVFLVEGERDGFVVLRYGAETFRVKPVGPILLRSVPAPPFTFGQKVRERGREEIGVISSIHWHSERDRPFFHLTIGGKLKKKRLFEEDLVACNGEYR